MVNRAPGHFKLGMVVFDQAEGRRRLETLAEWRRGVRDPLGLRALAGHLSGRLFPPIKSNMRSQVDRWLWVPAIVELCCDRTLEEEGSLASASQRLTQALEEGERRAWNEIGEALDDPRYRFRPRQSSHTWFGSLPHHAYMPTLRRMGLVCHSSAIRILEFKARESEDVEETSELAPPRAPRADAFLRAVRRRREWLHSRLFSRRPIATAPVLTSAEAELLREVLAWYGSTSRPSLFSWCLKRRVSISHSIASWHGSERLKRESPDLGKLVVAAGAFLRAADCVERQWLGPRLSDKGLRKKVPPAPAGFSSQRAQLAKQLKVLRAYVNGLAGEVPPSAEDAEERETPRAIEASLGVIEDTVKAAASGWNAVQSALADRVTERGKEKRRYALAYSMLEQEDDDNPDQNLGGLNLWLADANARGLTV